MKIPVKNIVISALLTFAGGLFMTAFAQNAMAQSVINVTGTTWVGTDSDGDYYEYTFQPNGVLHFKSPSGFFTNGTWQQVDDTIYMQTYYMQTTKKYSERMGQIKGTHMEGKAINIVGRSWSWVADMRSTTP
jgi:saccharopine dehydrogenase-like NADP-dependent oxidoreductase